MKFGLAFASSIGIEADDSLEICRRAEAAGFESVWGGEHVILPTTIESPYPYTADGKIPAQPDTPIPDPLIWLAYVAATAPTLRLGTCILIVPQRNPLVLAKELATLDRLTGGRVELGLGVGWMREEFVDFAPVTCSPRPIQVSIPILVGGDTPAAIRRAVRIADGYFPGEGDAVRLGGLISELRITADKHGRDPDTIEVNAMFGVQMADPVAGVEQLSELGVGRVMIPAFFFAGPGGLDRLSEFGERVIPSVR